MDEIKLPALPDTEFQLAIKTPERTFLVPLSLMVPARSLLSGDILERRYADVHKTLLYEAMGASGLTSVDQVRVIKDA